MDTKRYPPVKPGDFFECVPCIGGVLPTTVGRLVPGGYDPNPIPTWWFSGGEDFKGDSATCHKCVVHNPCNFD
jgi:hypothetical protein